MLTPSVTSLVVAAGVSICIIGLLSLAYRMKRKSRTKRAGKVAELLVYPIKSVPPLRVDTAECTEAGLRYCKVTDRQFMLVSSNDYVRLRLHLTLMNLELMYDKLHDSLLVNGPGMSTALSIPLKVPDYNPSLVQTITWYDNREVKFVEVGKEQSQWFSKYLDKDCMLVTMPKGVTREVNPEFTYNTTTKRHPETKVLFNDSHPYLVVNQSSIDELNGRMDESIASNTFRGGILLSSDDNQQLKPFEEDNWAEIYIGAKAVLFNERPCPRCLTINIGHPHPELRQSREPTTTLLKYRRGSRRKDKYVPMFGSNASLIAKGTISVGDDVVVQIK